MPDLRCIPSREDDGLTEALGNGTEAEYLASYGVCGLDGPWSDNSQALKEKLNATGFHFSRWWMLTSPEWSCSACGRCKFEIAKLDKNNLVSGHLHEHHDHMAEVAERLFAEISASRAKVVADKFGKKFIRKVANAISAYEPTVICSDCNSADAKAKGVLKLPKNFSFSPSEIGAFILPAPHKAHEIDRVKASEIWKELSPTFVIRMDFAKQLATIAAENEHWLQVTDHRDHPDALQKVAEMRIHAAVDETESTDWLGMYLKVVSPPSPPNKDLSKWRRRKHKKGVSSTRGEIDHLISTMTTDRWSQVPDDWYCPCCMREKREIVHKNKHGEWSFSVRLSKWYDVENISTDHIVCNDCYTASINFGREIRVLRSLFSIDDIAEVIMSAPHQVHGFTCEELIQEMLAGVRKRQICE